MRRCSRIRWIRSLGTSTEDRDQVIRGQRSRTAAVACAVACFLIAEERSWAAGRVLDQPRGWSWGSACRRSRPLGRAEKRSRSRLGSSFQSAWICDDARQVARLVLPLVIPVGVKNLLQVAVEPLLHPCVPAGVGQKNIFQFERALLAEHPVKLSGILRGMGAVSVVSRSRWPRIPILPLKLSTVTVTHVDRRRAAQGRSNPAPVSSRRR